MGSIRSRGKKSLLFFDFRYQGNRCRELTTLKDTPANRRSVEQVLDKIEAEITLGIFDYRKYFPNSSMADKFDAMAKGANIDNGIPLFKEFSLEWFEENQIRWKRSMAYTVKCTLHKYLVPTFGHVPVNQITRSDILKFRASMANPKTGKRISNDRINHVMTPLRQILKEGSYRYAYSTPFIDIDPLRVPQSEVEPFSIEDVQSIISNVRADFRNYYSVRFFTGMRTGEVDGLKWKYVDFNNKVIIVRETIVDGKEDTTKTHTSVRDIQMNSITFDALQQQFKVTGQSSKYVFCNKNGKPLDHRNVTKRVWYPLLRHLEIAKRVPYQTRHTAATLWLAAGENPEWIARQLGHANSQMLFRVYARYVPNLTRQDGSAFERLLKAQLFNQKKASNDE